MSTFGFLAPQDLWDARSEMFFSQVQIGRASCRERV